MTLLVTVCPPPIPGGVRGDALVTCDSASIYLALGCARRWAALRLGSSKREPTPELPPQGGSFAIGQRVVTRQGVQSTVPGEAGGLVLVVRDFRHGRVRGASSRSAVELIALDLGHAHCDSHFLVPFRVVTRRYYGFLVESGGRRHPEGAQQ